MKYPDLTNSNSDYQDIFFRHFRIAYTNANYNIVAILLPKISELETLDSTVIIHAAFIYSLEKQDQTLFSYLLDYIRDDNLLNLARKKIIDNPALLNEIDTHINSLYPIPSAPTLPLDESVDYKAAENLLDERTEFEPSAPIMPLNELPDS